MKKKFILAKMNFSIDFSDKTKLWLCNLEKTKPEFRNEIDLDYFSSNQEEWKSIFVNSSQKLIKEFFLDLGLPIEDLPEVEFQDCFSGSFVLNVDVVTTAAALVVLFNTIKGISELPKIYDGLVDLKNRLNKSAGNKASEKTYIDLNSIYGENPPLNPVITNVTIDARPLLAITPPNMISQKVQINVGVSRHNFTLENLGDESIRNLRIGLFKNISKNNLYDFERAYKNKIDILSAHNTINMRLSDFTDEKGNPFELPPEAIYVLCWVEDTIGIYFFTFYLDY